MKSVKVILMTMEILMLLGVVLLSLLTDWEKYAGTDAEVGMHALIVLMAVSAVVFQKEQQSIEWDEYEEEMILTSVEDVEL